MDLTNIGNEFIKFYYDTFDTNRSQLAPLYGPNSMLTFQQTQHLGTQSIVERLDSLSFQKVVHQVGLQKVDIQPSIHPGSVLISVTGSLKVDDEVNPLGFSQVFLLVPTDGTYYVHNDIFRLDID